MYDEQCVFWDESETGNIRLEGVMLSEGSEPLDVWLGTGCVCVLAPQKSDADAVMQSLRTLLATPKIALYLRGQGRYESNYGGTVTYCAESRILEEISTATMARPASFTKKRLEDMRDKLVRTDAFARGYYRNREGTLFLLRHGTFVRASDLDPEVMYLLTVFGGSLGLNRFYAGQFFRGLGYLLTCGFCLVGWILDALSMLLGVARDKNKDLICPLQDRGVKAAMLFLLVPLIGLYTWGYRRAWEGIAALITAAVSFAR